VIHTTYDPDELDAALRAVLNEQTQIHQSTTPQVGETATESVAASAADETAGDQADSVETTARKGGGAQ
jgi:hypothetical protein